MYFVAYPSPGVQVSFRTKEDNTVNAVFFYNKQRGDERFATFKVRTSERALSGGRGEDDVIAAYGQLVSDHKGADANGRWRRLVFDGIDFR